MATRYDPFTDKFISDGKETITATISIDAFPKDAVLMKQVELTEECIDRIADAVVRKLKADIPQTERKSCTLELFDDDGNYIEPQTD